MGRPVNRITPQLPAHVMKTYEISRPLSTHWRKATCEEVNCHRYAKGWRVLIDETSDLGQRQAYYIRRQSGRSFWEDSQGPGMTYFCFRAGQPCFRADEHRLPIERPELYLVRGGDWRGNPRKVPVYRHTSPTSWVDDFATNQIVLAEKIQQG